MTTESKLSSVRVALIQDAAPASISEARERLAGCVREAAANGANIFCTQELFQTEYFCWKQDPAFFDLAEPIPGEGTAFYAALAKECGVAPPM